MATTRTSAARKRSTTAKRPAAGKPMARKVVRSAPAAPVAPPLAAMPARSGEPAQSKTGKEAVIDQLKQRCAQLGHKAGKGRLQRAGLRLLAAQADAALLAAVRAAAKK